MLIIHLITRGPVERDSLCALVMTSAQHTPQHTSVACLTVRRDATALLQPIGEQQN